MNAAILSETTTRSLAGSLTFPEVVQTLIVEGVESYHTDLVQKQKTFYMPNGEVHIERLDFFAPKIAEDFSEKMVIKALRAIQSKEIDYREFLNQIIAAGTTNYTVYIQGKKAIYFGRKGEFHVENFPQAK